MGVNCATGRSYNDGNGHGSHVAGTIAANNDVGVMAGGVRGAAVGAAAASTRSASLLGAAIGDRNHHTRWSPPGPTQACFRRLSPVSSCRRCQEDVRWQENIVAATPALVPARSCRQGGTPVAAAGIAIRTRADARTDGSLWSWRARLS
jgi:subtilisin family serine protease